MWGCGVGVPPSHTSAGRGRFDKYQAMANSVAGVDSDRAVRYGSMMASAVPATGTLKVAASNATPLHRAEALSKQQPSSRHAASSNRKTLATCQADRESTR